MTSSICHTLPNLTPPLLLGTLLLILISQAAEAASPQTLNNGYNHRAHAVPGGPYSAPDLLTRSRATVSLSGELSHTHFFNPATGTVGHISSYDWRVNNVRICSTRKCTVEFPLGKTTLTLTVTDSTGDVSTASTTVTIYRATRPRLRLWYYAGNGRAPDSRHPVGARPSFSQTPPQLAMFTRSSFPSPQLQKPFTIRVLGNIEFVQVGTFRFRLLCGGANCALRINDNIIVSGNTPELISSKRFYTKSLLKLDVIFRRANVDAPDPKFALYWQTPSSTSWSLVPASRLFHIPEAYIPVLHDITPTKAAVGSRITLSGSSILNLRKIYVGGSLCVAPIPQSQFSISCVVPGGSGPRPVRIITKIGSSNNVSFNTTTSARGTSDGSENPGPLGYYQSIGFTKGELKARNGSTWTAEQLTSIALGPDGRFYLGSLNGFVHAITVGMDNTVYAHCRSAKVGVARSILGVGFNPAHTKQIKVYATTSTMTWLTRDLFPYVDGWHNGQVVILEQTGNACLEQTKTLITGLPVSNYDHSVNGISFDQNGNLLITVAGTSNAGVSIEDGPLGGIPDSPLSGAMLSAPVLRDDFRGDVKYSQYTDPATTWKVAGQVFLYATGLRNSFAHVVHSNGKVYATDNGANTGFGAKSIGCNAEGVALTEQDSLYMIKRGGFHGYANRNRGRRDTKQCFHKIKAYVKPITYLEPSTNGILEYTANTFGGQMRGDLLLTKFAVRGQGKTLRVQLKKDGYVATKSELAPCSGLSVAMTPTGALLMPRVYQGKVVVLNPTEENPRRVVVTSVTPHRGPQRGGNRVKVTGWNLYPPLSATVGGRPCHNIGHFTRNGRSFECNVPKGTGRAPVVVKKSGELSKSFGFEYWYMNV